MWGTSIVGFGRYHHKYETGQEDEWFLTGFSPRKHNLTIYVMPGFDLYKTVLQQLGKYKIGKSRLYVKRLNDADRTILRELVKKSVRDIESQ